MVAFYDLMSRIFSFCLTLRIVVAVLLPVALTAMNSTPGTADSGAIAFAQKIGDESIADLSDPALSDSLRVKRMREMLAKSFDVSAVSQFVLGHYARSTKPVQFMEFMNLYEIYVAHNYAGLFKHFNGEKVIMQTERQLSTGDILVSGVIEQKNRPTAKLEVRVRMEGQNFKAIDLKVEGVSMAITHRKQFASVIRQHGGLVSGLIDALRAAGKRFEARASSE